MKTIYKQSCIIGKQLAADLGCLFESHIYEEYGFFQLSFETDRFGGIASLFTYSDGHFYDEIDLISFASDTPLDKVFASVPEQLARLQESRDLAAVSERINEEY